MASAANQKKIVTAANKVRTITDTQYMVQLHLILRKTAAAQGTAAALTTVQRTTLTQQTVTDIPASVIKLWTTLHTVSRHVNTNPAYLPFLQKIHTPPSYISETALRMPPLSNLGNIARSNSMAIYKSSF